MNARPTHLLPTKPNKDHIDALQLFLIENRGKGVDIDAHEVSSISGQQLEVLMSGYKDWSQDAQDFDIIRCPDDIMKRLTFVGVPAQLFSKGS